MTRSERERYWRGVLARQRSSGMSIREFCRIEGVSEPSFFSWRRRIEQAPWRGAAGDEAQREAGERGAPRGRARFVGRRPGRSSGPEGRRQENGGADGDGSVGPDFAPVEIVGDGPAMEICSPDGWTVQVAGDCDSALLRAALAALREGRS